MTSRLRSLSFRLALIAVLAMAGIAAVAFLGLRGLHASLDRNKEGELRRIVEMSESIARAEHDRAVRGEITDDVARKEAMAAIGRLRYDRDNYVFVLTTAGEIVVHPNPRCWGPAATTCATPTARPSSAR